jgi:ABC-type sugar transport system ATPase subunit
MKPTREVQLDSPKAASEAGIAYVSEDRKRSGLLPPRSVRQNLISSELPELLGVTDCILVMHDRRVVAAFNTHATTEEQIAAAAMGHRSEVTSS